jgi:hypothetical protein
MQALLSGYTVEISEFNMNYHPDDDFVSEKVVGEHQ